MKPAKSEGPRWYLCNEAFPERHRWVELVLASGEHVKACYKVIETWSEGDIAWRYVDPAPAQQTEGVSREEFDDLFKRHADLGLRVAMIEGVFRELIESLKKRELVR